MVEGSLLLNWFRTPILIAMPVGVTNAKAKGRVKYFVLVMLSALMVAMRAPSAKPSKTWWKTMTINRVMTTESPATTRVIPRSRLWNMIPASRIRTLRISLGYVLLERHGDGRDSQVLGLLLERCGGLFL